MKDGRRMVLAEWLERKSASTTWRAKESFTFFKVTVEPTQKENRGYRPTSGYSGISGSTIEEYEGKVSDGSYEVVEDKKALS